MSKMITTRHHVSPPIENRFGGISRNSKGMRFSIRATRGRAPVLKLFDVHKEFVIETDACCLGACLIQGVILWPMHPIAACFRKKHGFVTYVRSTLLYVISFSNLKKIV